MATTIKCNKCGEEIEVTTAIRKELEQKILQETENKHNQIIKDLKQEQIDLIKQKDIELAEKKREILINARQMAIKKVTQEYDTKIKLAQEESTQRKRQHQELQDELLKVTRQLRLSEGAKSKIKLDYEKKLSLEQEQIKLVAKKEAAEELNLKIAEKDKKLGDATKQINELKRKIEQGSQQLQGEILELKLENLLKKNFPFDEIKEVPKGIRGADVIQIVKSDTGVNCGTIIWESKNTKTWSTSWVQKLIEDQRALKAELAVLVSTILPKEILESGRFFGQLSKIWISDIKSSISLASALRQQLIGIKSAQEINKGKSTKAEVVYNYLTSNNFKQRIDVLVEYFRDRQESLQRERLYYNKKWEKEAKEIDKVFASTAGMYGDLQGLIGTSLPQIKYLELPEN